MIYLYVRQQVNEYSRWKEAFDCHLAARQAGGATTESLLLCNADDPQEIIVLMGWRDLRQARLFIESVSWQMALKEMGGGEAPEVLFLETMRKIIYDHSLFSRIERTGTAVHFKAMD